MRFYKYSIITLVLGLFANVFGQYMSAPKLSGVGLPFFHAAIFRTFNEENSQQIVRLYLQMINDDLTFIKQNDKFSSEIQIDIFVTNKQKESIFSRTIKKQIESSSFDETNSRDISNTFTTDVPLSPGEYDAVVTILDKNSGKQVNRKVNFVIPDIKKQKFLISDILLFSKFEKDSTGQISSFEPNLTNNFSGTDEYIYFYFSSIMENPNDSLHIEYTVKNPAGATVLFNQYALLDVALHQMRYIMDADSIGWALKQPYDEKLAYFNRFWKRMDPNQETEKNELLDEYYRRVNFTNESYSNLSMDGWESDRGRIFIKFGEPDDIERHPFEMSTMPYVVWRYYDLRKIFLFIDRTGFGDYYLDPNYLEEEYN
ncbi:MAG: GWxTD domain-containing protein [Calditrichia bacterium]